jgi:diguanylate cyclase (GGDEF)-like protein
LKRFTTSPAVATVIGLLGIAVIGALDYSTGYEIRLMPLYFLPIAFAAWRLPGWAALTFAVLGAATWAVSNWLAGRIYPPPILTINFASQLVAFAVVGYLVAELRRRLGREQQLSRQDPLTGLPNSRAFYEHGERILALARRSGRQITLAYFDLDDFKKVNDDHGHCEGDRALTETAAGLAGLMRESDFVARLGGDEFAILLPDTGADAARISLERLQNEIVLRMRRNGWPVSVSIGAVTYQQAPGTLEDAVHDADSVMYRAKESGKNRVLVAAVERGSVRLPRKSRAPAPADDAGFGRTGRRASR